MYSTGVHFIDITGAEALANEARSRRNAGGALYLVDMKESVEELRWYRENVFVKAESE